MNLLEHSLKGKRYSSVRIKLLLSEGIETEMSAKVCTGPKRPHAL